jgi:hypothetical protein
MNGTPEKIEQVLSSLDGLQRAEASPFLYTRLKGRLQKVNEFVPARIAWGIAAALGVVLLLNLATIKQLPAQHQTVTNNGAALVASEYAISLSQTY